MATLVYTDVDGVDRSFSLGAEPILVGRGAECAIRSEDPRVSRNHARFFVDQGALWVEDLGSSNGIYVGPNKVNRAPVPTGEIVLVGSLVIRLLPASGTLPPPNGLHGTLAQWLEMERKARSAVEDERNAFAKRVGELHEELRAAGTTQGAHAGDAEQLRTELDALRATSAKELEAARLEAAKAREAKIIAETQKGIDTAERFAETDMTISRLEGELATAKRALGEPDPKTAELAAELVEAKARADKADKELAAAQIRAQGAERSVSDGAAKLAAVTAELDQLKAQFETRAQRLGELESTAAKATETAGSADSKITAAKTAEASARAAESAVKAELVAEKARAETAEQRARAADSMAKAMAKDVAEALHRAVEADRARVSQNRAFEDAKRRAIDADAREAERLAAIAEAERLRAEIQAQVGATQRDSAARIDQAARELAAERKGTLALVDRKTQLERELADAKTAVPALEQRAATAERKLAEYEVQLAAHEDKIQDLEGTIALEQATATAAIEQTQARIAELEHQLASVQSAAADQAAGALDPAELQAAHGKLDSAMRELDALRRELEAARAKLGEAERRTADSDRRAAEAEQRAVDADQLVATAEQRAVAAEEQVTHFATSSEEADLAIGRAMALQRQLDEALAKLAWAERSTGGATNVHTPTLEAIAEAERRVHDAETQASQLAAQLRDTEQRGREIEARAKDIEGRAKDAAERIVDAERRARDSEGKIVAATEQAAQLTARVAQLQGEVDAAENVRQFAANTEREIAGLQRELRAAKERASLLETERELEQSTNRRSAMREVVREPEVTAKADVSRYTSLVARATELEQKLADAEARLAAQHRAQEDEPTRTGNALPIEFAEHLSALEESIDSLRSNMRAASDETATMEQSESVVAVSGAVSAAAEHVERARDAVKALTRMLSTT